MRQTFVFWYSVIFLCQFGQVQADTIEQQFARSLVKNYSPNEIRLKEIAKELETLPTPYLREPTGTGGFLSHGQSSSSQEVILRFDWSQPQKIDAVALFPLRLFMDEIYSENLYWPGSITIEAEIDGETKVIAKCHEKQILFRQSLPELIEFDQVTTPQLIFRCSDLPQHPHENWYAAGFAEICIFSGADNLAPRATVNATYSRQGYHVLAKEFLTDNQTPLGLPELNNRSKNYPYLKKLGWGRRPPKKPYILTLSWDRSISIDAIRIDPAIQHAYGQSFPLRFTIELLDEQSQVIHANNFYRNFPLRSPGLNPWYCYFPETKAQTVRLTVLAASQPVRRALQAIAFSEITAIHKGRNQILPTVIEDQFLNSELRIKRGAPLDTPEKQALASAADGFTQTGRLLPLRQWIEELVRRQLLLEEQIDLQDVQEKTLLRVRTNLIQGSLLLLIIVTAGAIYYVARNRIRSHKEIRATRLKIASDLHDDVGSNLGAIILHIERLEEQIKLPPEPKRLRAIYRLTRESVFGLREVLSATAPEVGRTQSLVTYMDELASLILGRTKYTFNVEPAIDQAPLAQSTRRNLLLFYKEALHNAHKHADCNQIDIALQPNGSTIILTIEDDGKGITPQLLKKKRTLRTLKQRADWLHADLQIQSTPHEGTNITLTIPKALP